MIRRRPDENSRLALKQRHVPLHFDFCASQIFRAYDASARFRRASVHAGMAEATRPHEYARTRYSVTLLLLLLIAEALGPRAWLPQYGRTFGRERTRRVGRRPTRSARRHAIEY